MSNGLNPIRAGDTASAAIVAHILNGLRNRTLPKREWTHHAHLTAAVALLNELGLAGAESEMPGLIRAYNEATGVVNNDSEGYHHTITLFFLRRINQYLAPYAGDPIEARVTQILNSPLAETTYPLGYYSRELLFSVKARRAWAAPDLKPINS